MIDATLEIRRLNDSFRRSLSGGGKRLMTAGIAALPPQDQAAILAKVIALMRSPRTTIRTANTTSARSITQGTAFGSENPADPAKTTRVLTIMFADEY